jgi:hypothetical protein
MNGRVYDPTIGRFLSADPIIQTLALSQATNPFSYVMNQPLTLTDPTGLSWLSKHFRNVGNFLKKWGSLILGVVLCFFGVGAIWIAVWCATYNAAVNGGTIGSFAIGLVVGMVAGGIASGIGGAASSAIGAGGSGLIASVVRGAIVGGLAGGITSTIMGGSFMQGFAAGALGGAIGAAARYGLEEAVMQYDGAGDKRTGSEKTAAGADMKLSEGKDGVHIDVNMTYDRDGFVRADVAEKYAKNIEQQWSVSDQYDGKSYSMTVHLTEAHWWQSADLHFTGLVNANDVGAPGQSLVSRMLIYITGNENATTPGHEFGHILGLGDTLAYGPPASIMNYFTVSRAVSGYDLASIYKLYSH